MGRGTKTGGALFRVVLLSGALLVGLAAPALAEDGAKNGWRCVMSKAFAEGELDVFVYGPKKGKAKAFWDYTLISSELDLLGGAEKTRQSPFDPNFIFQIEAPIVASESQAPTFTLVGPGLKDDGGTLQLVSLELEIDGEIAFSQPTRLNEPSLPGLDATYQVSLNLIDSDDEANAATDLLSQLAVADSAAVLIRDGYGQERMRAALTVDDLRTLPETAKSFLPILILRFGTGRECDETLVF